MFLKKCRRQNLLPKSLNLNLTAFNHSINEGVLCRLSKQFSRTLQNEVIKQLYRNIEHTEKNLKRNEEFLSSIIPPEIHQNFTKKLQETRIKLTNKLTEKHKNKFTKLIEPEIKNVNTTHHSNWIKNLSGKEIPQECLNILSLGGKFSLPVNNNKIPTDEIVAHLEPVIQKLEQPAERIELRNKLCNILTNHKKMRTKKTTRDTIFQSQCETTKQSLKDNPEIIILNADKGNVTVIMKKDDYIDKMQQLLKDEKTYEILPDDPTNKIEAKCNRLITQWKNNDYISKKQARSLRRYNSIIAKMYGQVKIHKDGNPLRPIVSSIQSPTYNLSKWYANILKNVTGKTRRSIKNATQFKEKMKNTRLPDGYVLVSLDVISLFTKIPNELVYKAIDKQWFKIKKYTSLPKSEFTKGMKMILENCTFSFNNVIYQQIFGSPMGSPVSPILADLVMEQLEDGVIHKLKFRLPFYTRFVDDCCTSCPENKAEELQATFNSYDVNIQFTIEKENDLRIAFLDIMLIRQRDGFVKTDWFHKKTWSGRYLNYHSNLPFTYKRNTISILTDKVLKLADPEFHNKNFKLITDTLKKNGYPKKLIQTTMENTYKKSTTKESTPYEKTTKKFVAVPYVKGILEKIKPLFQHHNITVVGKGINNLKQQLFSNLKDKVPKMKQTHAIYLVTCSCGKTYVGQTMRHLEKRISDHQYHTRTKNHTHSALCDHLINTQHIVDWNEVKIIHKEQKQKVRDVMEMILIKKTENTMNKQNECKFLSNTYNNVLNINKRTQPPTNQLAICDNSD